MISGLSAAGRWATSGATTWTPPAGRSTFGLPSRSRFFPPAAPIRTSCPHGEIGYYHFPRRGDKPALKIVWYSGGLLPDAPEELPRGTRLPKRGVLFIGDKGKMLVRRGRRPAAPDCRSRKPTNTRSRPRLCLGPKATTATGWMPSREAHPPSRNSSMRLA